MTAPMPADAIQDRPYSMLVEPLQLIKHFLAHPPMNFETTLTPSGTPVFFTRFDLLTTADKSLKRLLARLPLYQVWRHWLRPRSMFAGTTVSEYVPLPDNCSPSVLVDELLRGLLRDGPREHSFVIIKDIPHASPLLDEGSNAFAQAFEDECRAAGFTLVEGQALAWVPIDFLSAHEFVARLSSGRRRDIRRKLRRRAELAIEVLPTGAPQFGSAQMRAQLYRLYRNVYEQSDVHFDLLTPAFFDAVFQDPTSGGRIFLYRHNGRLIGHNVCFVIGDTLIDKYIGFEYPTARHYNLYVVSWMLNLDYAASHGLKRYIAGWTDPQIKAYLGANFTFTRHAVYPRNRLIRALLTHFRRRFESDRAWFDRNIHETDGS